MPRSREEVRVDAPVVIRGIAARVNGTGGKLHSDRGGLG